MYKLLIYTFTNSEMQVTHLNYLEMIFEDFHELQNHIWFLETYGKRKRLRYLFKILPMNENDKIIIDFD